MELNRCDCIHYMSIKKQSIITVMVAGLLLPIGITGCTSTPAPPAAPAAPAEETVEEPAASSTTASQDNAVRKAKQYLSTGVGFSRAGLIKQLEFEKFSTEDATFGVDNVEVDWNAEAAAKAKSYNDLTPMSRDALITQLEFEGFTPEEAAFGATAIGL